VEEEAIFGLQLKNLKRLENDGRGLMMMDKVLDQHSFNIPTGMTITGA